MGRIIVAHEKHSTDYYDAHTDEEWARSSLEILTRRWNDGYWYHKPDELFDDTSEWSGPTLAKILPDYDASDDVETLKKKIEAYRQANIAVIPDDDARMLVANKLSKAIRRHNDKLRYVKEYDEIREVVESQDVSFVTYKSGRTEP